MARDTGADEKLRIYEGIELLWVNGIPFTVKGERACHCLDCEKEYYKVISNSKFKFHISKFITKNI